jgi:hypothetical protein
MPDLLSKPEREQLQQLEEQIEKWQDDLRNDLASSTAQAGIEAPVDPEYVERFVETAQRLTSRVHEQVPRDLDPEALAEIRGRIFEGLQALVELDEARPLDSVDRFFVHAEAVRHIVRDALDGQPDGDESDAQELLESISKQIPGVSRKELGSLIGVGERQVQRLMKDGGAASRRLQMVARLVSLLYRSWTPAGVVAWFYRERADLDNRAPIDLLDDVEYERRVLLAARRGRAQHGS